MVINNLGILNLEKISGGLPDDPCNTTYQPHSMAFVVTSSDGLQTQGKLDNEQYAQFTPSGSPPYSVKVGYQNWSYSSTVDGLQSADYAVSFTTIFPSGTDYTGNGAKAFVNKLVGKGAVEGAAE
jgi:hypothetical protein